MYQYAFFSRILAIIALVLVGLVCLPTSIQHFRLKSKVDEAQNYMQLAQRDQTVLSNLVPELVRYSAKDPSILTLLQKYGLNVATPPAEPPAQPKPKKK